MLDMVWHLKQVQHARQAHGRTEHHANNCSQRYFFEYKMDCGMRMDLPGGKVGTFVALFANIHRNLREIRTPNHAEISVMDTPLHAQQ